MPAFSKNLLFGIVIAILLITTSIFGVLLIQTKQEVQMKRQEVRNLEKQLEILEAKVKESAQKQTQAEAINTSTWKTYRNEKYGFEVKYPQSMMVELYESVDQSNNKAQFSIGIFESKFADKIEGEIPQLIITDRFYGNRGRNTRFFTSQDVYSDTRQKLEEWIAEIHFEEDGNNVEAKCILFKSFETESMKGLPLCNQILSTFKFLE